MGIKGLLDVIDHLCPDAVKEQPDLQSLCGQVIAMDASMCIYQALISTYLKNVPSDTDSRHLKATFYLNIRLLRSGLRPLYVFGGTPPEQKMRKLRSRAQKKEKAQNLMKQAHSVRDFKKAAKHRWQTLKIENHHVEATKDLLKVMGIPYLQAPGETDAQCAELVRTGKAYASASESFSSLTYGSSLHLRHLITRKKPAEEFHLDKILTGVGVDSKEFIDLSILLGCDYCSAIKNVGPITAVKLIRKYRNIETILQNLNTEVYKVPQDWRYNEARYLFTHPVVTKSEALEFQWKRPDTDKVTKFVCEKSKLSKVTVLKLMKKLAITR